MLSRSLRVLGVRLCALSVAVCALCSGVLRGAAEPAPSSTPPSRGLPPALDATDLVDIDLALHALKMTEQDLSFQKTNAESELVLQKTRMFLQQPLTLPAYGQYLMTNLQAVGSLGALADLAREQLEVPSVNYIDRLSRPVEPDEKFLSQLPPAVARAVQGLCRAAGAASTLLPHPNDAAFAAFSIESLDNSELDGLSEQVRAVVRRKDVLELQDDELANTMLTAGDQLNRPALMLAFSELSRAVDEAIATLQAARDDQSMRSEFQVETDTPLGKIICGGAGRNVYTNDAFLIVDTGGGDVYLNDAGGANGLAGRPVSIVIDLGGDDQFVSRRSFSQGAGVFGIGILVALGSNCTFAARHMSQGAGFFGCGMLATGQGKQTFEADTFCQGAGMFGAGILWQRGGDTTYRACEMAQGFGGTSGFGLLLDRSGNDLYYAGGKHACGWLPGQYFSLAQGFGYGMRPFAGGGIGVLCDLKGDDRYIADVYGQGASYWYSTGLLLETEGNDFYQAYQYCQGAGIHLSSGALIDWSGDDQYSAFAICQGGAHDYAVGMLIDRAGNDRYDAVSTAQGSAINNSFAMLLDHAGDDFYAGRDPKGSQAAGHDGGKREYGSIALLLDLAGNDVYSQGTTNNEIWLKPLYGAGLDCEATNQISVVRRSHDLAQVMTEGLPSLVETWRSSDAARSGDPRRTAKEGASQKRLYTIEPVNVHHPVERLLRRALRDTDTEEHRKDAEAAWIELKQSGVQDLPYLLTRLDTPDVLVRAKIEELIDHLGTNSVPALIAGIEKARNDEVARLCCYFLARFGDQAPLSCGSGLHPRSSYSVNRVAVENRSHTIRDQAIKAVELLITREKTRSTAFYTLGHLRAGEGFEPALDAMNDPKEIVRLRAAQALGRILSVAATSSQSGRIAAGRPLLQMQTEAIPKLIAAFDDKMWDVRYAAEDALVAIGKPSVAPLRRSFPKANPRARPHIVATLARLGDRHALSLARAQWQTEDPQVRTAMERELTGYLNHEARSQTHP